MPTQCEIIERPAQPTLAVRTRTPVAELPSIMGQVYGSIMQYLGDVGAFPAGAPFAAYYNVDMDDLDVEIGFPVAQPLPGRGDVQPGKIAGGRAAVCLHVGPYDQVEPAYAALTAFISEQGYQPSGVAYEFYLNDPGEVPPEELQTQVVFPLK